VLYPAPVNDSAPSWRIAVLWFLLALVAGLLFAHAAVPGIAPASDLWDHSQAARQIARGEGFTSLYTYPLFLGQDQPPFPIRWRMPLYALLGALLLKLGIALPGGFLYLGAVAHGLLVALTYWLGARLHSARVGSWAAACALLCPLLLNFYNPGLSQGPAAVLDLVVWILLLGSGGALGAGLAAVAAAGAWHLRIESLLFVPIWFWVAARRESGGSWRWPRAATFLVVYVALCLPWFLVSHRARGAFDIHPMLLYTAEYPGYSSSRTLGANLPGPLQFVSSHLGAFALRFVKDAAGYLIDVLDGFGPLAIGIAVAGALWGGFNREIIRRHAPLFVAVGLQILAMSALERNPLFLIPIVPLILVLLGIAAAPALGRVRHGRALTALLLVIALERGGRLLYQRADAARRFPPVPADTAPELMKRAPGWPRAGLLLSDAPDWIAWYLDRPALLLPLRAQLDSLAATRPVSAIWLSPGARARNVADGDTAWVGVMDRGEHLRGFSGPEAMSGGSSLYVKR